MRLRDIHFYRLTSRLIPLANHEELLDWDYMKPLKEMLHEMGDFAKKHNIRVDFHPDHFVVINSIQEAYFEKFNQNLKDALFVIKGNGD